MKYRPEIDGLRSLAVLPIILFHAGFTQFSGGFVGVDIFFVISGYLITTIILSEKEKGTFSLVTFYERRARRILPALFLVLFSSFLFAWWWLPPVDMVDFSQSLVAVSTFVSNILFWRETGYWGVENELKPLLHTWSLAVEEQYYVLFPIFLTLMWRFPKRWILTSFILISGLSFSAAQWGAYHRPVANFFLLPTRSWELAIGAIIAFYFAFRTSEIRILLSHKLADETLSFLGLLMIGYSVFAFDKTVPFPSFYTLLPTIGTGLIIVFSSSTTLVGRLLGTRILVGIGLVSYSAYLWHQPLFSFYRHVTLAEPQKVIFALLGGLSFLLAYLSWRYVEAPFRNKEIVSRKTIFITSLLGSLFFLIVGVTGVVTNGFDIRVKNSRLSLQAAADKIKINTGLGSTCDGTWLSPDCKTSDAPEILIWGDSFGMHLIQGLMASNPDAKVIQMTKSVCGPFFDIAPLFERGYSMDWTNGCLEYTQKVRDWLRVHKSVKYVVMSSPYRQFLSKEAQLSFRNGEIVDSNIDVVAKELNSTLAQIKAMGAIPVIFSPPPFTGVDLGRCLVRANWRGANLDECNFSVHDISQEQEPVDRLFERIDQEYKVIDLKKLICDESICKTHLGATFIYKDTVHLSHEGSAALGKTYDFYKLIVSTP